MQNDFSQQILRTDAAGMPLDWVSYKEAARCYYLGQVLYSCGKLLYTVHGGINSTTGTQSKIDVNSIIATQGDNQTKYRLLSSYTPALTNKTLFSRDGHVCMYCGNHFMHSGLSRDHITPTSQNGQDIWTNVITACRRCNNFKAGRTPEQAGVQLLAVPFSPTHAEYVYLRGRRVMADQMEFLKAHFPRTSPLRNRLSELQTQSLQSIYGLD